MVFLQVYFGTGHARMYLFPGLLDALRLRVNCCTGMSCLMRKKVLDEGGGEEIYLGFSLFIFIYLFSLIPHFIPSSLVWFIS